jgi:CheY-like chemotaxis protein
LPGLVQAWEREGLPGARPLSPHQCRSSGHRRNGRECLGSSVSPNPTRIRTDYSARWHTSCCPRHRNEEAHVARSGGRCSVSNDGTLILVVEDNSSIRLLLHELFMDEGYRVASCGSAAQAVETLKRAVPALVISDMHMEHTLAGLDLLRYIRQRPDMASVPVIIYTAYSRLMATLATEVNELGAVVVPKPFDVDALVARVRGLTVLRENEAS